MSRLAAEVGELQSQLQQLTEEREILLGQLHAKTGSLREAERAVASQQAKLAQQQRQAKDTAQASEKVLLSASSALFPIAGVEFGELHYW